MNIRQCTNSDRHRGHHGTFFCQRFVKCFLEAKGQGKQRLSVMIDAT